MIQLTEDQEYLIFKVIFIAIVIISITIVAYMIVSVESDQYNDPCRKLTEHFVELSKFDCISYLNENPGATGQNVLDHYNILTIDQVLENPVDQLLENQLIPVN